MTEETETAKALREMREEMRRRAETVMDRMGETNIEPQHVTATLSAIEQFDQSIRAIEHAIKSRRIV
jgi:hypothetical protein